MARVVRVAKEKREEVCVRNVIVVIDRARTRRVAMATSGYRRLLDNKLKTGYEEKWECQDKMGHQFGMVPMAKL